MSRVPITLRIPVDPSWTAGHHLQVYCDFGLGEIDTDRPLLARPLEVFPGEIEPAGYGESAYGEVPYGDLAPSLGTGGYGDQGYGEAPYGGGDDYVEAVVYVDDDYGSYAFAAYAIDAEGNEQSDPLDVIEVFVSGREPPMLSGFAFSGYDKGTDTAAFAAGMG